MSLAPYSDYNVKNVFIAGRKQVKEKDMHI